MDTYLLFSCVQCKFHLSSLVGLLQFLHLSILLSLLLSIWLFHFFCRSIILLFYFFCKHFPLSCFWFNHFLLYPVWFNLFSPCWFTLGLCLPFLLFNCCFRGAFSDPFFLLGGFWFSLLCFSSDCLRSTCFWSSVSMWHSISLQFFLMWLIFSQL